MFRHYAVPSYALTFVHFRRSRERAETPPTSPRPELAPPVVNFAVPEPSPEYSYRAVVSVRCLTPPMGRAALEEMGSRSPTRSTGRSFRYAV